MLRLVAKQKWLFSNYRPAHSNRSRQIKSNLSDLHLKSWTNLQPIKVQIFYILLHGGDKFMQSADIEKAKAIWAELEK